MNMSNEKKNRDARDRDDTMGAQDNQEGTQATGSAEEKDQERGQFGRDES